MRESTVTITTRDDLRVQAWHWQPDEGVDVVGVVQLAHGLAEHAARYRWFAQHLTAAGWAVLAGDHRGHGRTAPGPDELGFFAEERGWAKVVDDLHRTTQQARALHADVPLVLFGHSMGSFLSQQYLFTFPGAVEGAVLSGSNGPAGALGEVGALVARVERRRLGPHGRSELLSRLGFGANNRPFEPTRTDFDWLSRDPAQVDAYVEDPFCGFMATTQLWLDLLAGLRVIADPDRVAGIPADLPVLLLSGSEDPIGGTRGVRRLQSHYEGAGMRRVATRLYDGGRHEMLNETNRDEVVADVLAWLDRQVLAHA